MDKGKPFVGDQSPRIALDSATPHGIRQSGLTLVKGKKYAGRIYLRGTPGSKVKVTLIWGAGEGDGQTITIPALTIQFKRFPLSFTAEANSTDGTIEITGTGAGNFHVGTLSLMPTDSCRQAGATYRREDRAATRWCRAGTPVHSLSPTGTGTTRSATSTSGHLYLTVRGTPCRRTI
jgi:hypothetical protein